VGCRSFFYCFFFIEEGGVGVKKRDVEHIFIGSQMSSVLFFIDFSSVLYRIPSESQITRYLEWYFQLFSLPSPCAFYHEELLLQVITQKSLS